MATYYVDMKVEKKKKEKTESIFLGYILSYLLKLITRVLLHFFSPPQSALWPGTLSCECSWACVISAGIYSPPMCITTHVHLRNVKHETDHELDLNKARGDHHPFRCRVPSSCLSHLEEALFIDVSMDLLTFYSSLYSFGFHQVLLIYSNVRDCKSQFPCFS
jgi:hypothetical protein